MHRRNTMANLNVLHLFFDNVSIFTGYCIACSLYLLIMNRNLFTEYMWINIIFAMLFTLSMLVMRMYNITTFHYTDRIIKRVTASALVAGMTISMMIFLADMEQISRLFFIIFCVASCMAVVSERIVIRIFKKNHWGNGYSHILFVGDDCTLQRYMKFIDKTSIKLKIEEFIGYGDPSTKSVDAFSRMLMRTPVDEVHFVFSLDRKNEFGDILPLLNACDSMGRTARIILDTFDLPVSKSFVSSVGTYPVITYHSISLDKFQLFIKSVIDRVGAALGLVLLAPVFIITAIAIKLDSPGPVFFKQTRAGAHGNEFLMYKFRSMFVGADEQKQELSAMNKVKGGLMFKIDEDPRVTKVGAFIRRTSLDELPQLFNVLKCDMSLVGTRPPTMDEVEKYNPEHWRRISIQPGITGMWQVSGRSEVLDFNDVIRLDKKYIDEWSLLLDLKLILQTVKVVITMRGAS